MKCNFRSSLQVVELLESRVLLSAAASAAVDGLTAAQVRQLNAAAAHPAHHTKGALGRLSSNLAQIYLQNKQGTTLTADSFGTVQSKNAEPLVIVHLKGGVSTALRRLEKLGLSVQEVGTTSKFIQGYLPVGSLQAAAKVAKVTSITSVSKPIVHSAGVATNQGEQAMAADVAKTMFGLTGAGVKVGVISDSVDQFGGGLASSIASGDLPGNVTVLQDGQPGDIDEGRAMMEEIYDIAPGAQLYFYSGDAGQSGMATAIASLQSAGCTIIVDDLGYADEPMFQEGVISQQIDTFVKAGGSYFSAIGNDGFSGYQRQDVSYSNTFAVLNPSGLTTSAQQSLPFTLVGGATLTLEWDNPYNGITGSATSELDLYIYDATGRTLITSSTNFTINGAPEQTVQLDAGSYVMQIKLTAMSAGAKAPDMFKFVATSDGAGSLGAVGYPGIRSSGYGHAVGQYTISVGAVPFSNAPPFSSTTPIRSEDFSGTGPITETFDVTGTKLPTPLTLQKPDVSGIDGINTSFFGDVTSTDPTRLQQFFGTSAAAPNVAAVAALMDQYHPGSSEAVIDRALIASTTPLNGQTPGTWDPQGGYGLVNAVRALQYFANPPVTPTVTLTPVPSPQAGGISSESIVFNVPVTGFTTADLTLTLDGGKNLLTATQTLTTTDNATFTLTNLAGLTAAVGTYTLTFSTANNDVTSINGLTVPVGGSVTWTVG